MESAFAPADILSLPCSMTACKATNIEAVAMHEAGQKNRRAVAWQDGSTILVNVV